MISSSQISNAIKRREAKSSQLKPSSTSSRLTSITLKNALQASLIEDYFRVRPVSSICIMYPNFLRLVLEQSWSPPIVPDPFARIGPAAPIHMFPQIFMPSSALDLSTSGTRCKKELWDTLLLIYATMGAWITSHPTITGLSPPASLIPGDDLSAFGAGRTAFCMTLTEHLLKTIYSLKPSVFSVLETGIFGLLITSEVVRVCTPASKEEDIPMLRTILQSSIEGLKCILDMMPYPEHRAAVVDLVGAMIWSIDVELAVRARKEPLLTKGDIVSIFSHSTRTPPTLYYNIRPNIELHIDAEAMHLARILPISALTLRRSALLLELELEALSLEEAMPITN
ncbi:hypothetical protein BT69DRAFT_1346053, partial [Atractiella rhizophila]